MTLAFNSYPRCALISSDTSRTASTELSSKYPWRKVPRPSTPGVLTKGGPNKATEVLLHTIYSEGFSFLRMGYASAMTVVFIAGIFFLTQLQHLAMERKTHY